MNQRNRLDEHFSEAAQLLDTVRNDAAFMDAVEAAGTAMCQAIAQGGKIISCGNGGSMSDAMHFAEELSGRYRDDRDPIAAMCLSDVSVMTCIGNDYGFERVFARQIDALGNPGDVLLAISTSGQSANVLEAVRAAKARGIHVLALTGKDGGALAPLADVEVRVPWSGYADRIQEMHIKCIHAWIDAIEQAH